MISDSALYLQFGVVMVAAFLGAALASRLKQSVILGYIAAGALIGPYMSFNLFGLRYHGLVQDTELLSYFAKMGLVLLLFFVGLEFSVSKLKKTRTAATILAVFNFAMDMFIGIIFGYFLGWPIMESFFLAAIIATGSSAVAAKTLMEIGRLTAPETDFIIGMSVVEDFIAMLLLTIAGGFVLNHSSHATLLTLVLAIASFYAVFMFIAILIVPRVIKKLDAIRNDELFILFALGIVFMSAAMAQMLYVQSLIGSFFIGMVFAETRMTEKLKSKLMSMRDAFVAIFFVYFGMLINPSVLISVLPIVAIAVPLMLFSDVLLTSSVAILIGFPSRHAFFVGSTSAFRGAESMLFATVGGSSVGNVYSQQLYAIAAPFALAMDLIAIPMLKNSTRLVRYLGHKMPRSIWFSSMLISRTFSKLVMPQPLKIYGSAKRSTYPLWSFILISSISIFIGYPLKLALLSCALLCAYLSLLVLKKDLGSSINLINYSNLGVRSGAGSRIHALIMKLVSGLMVTTVAVIAVSSIFMVASLVPIALYACYAIYLLHRTSMELGIPSKPGESQLPQLNFNPAVSYTGKPVVHAGTQHVAYLRMLKKEPFPANELQSQPRR